MNLIWFDGRHENSNINNVDHLPKNERINATSPPEKILRYNMSDIVVPDIEVGELGTKPQGIPRES